MRSLTTDYRRPVSLQVAAKKSLTAVISEVDGKRQMTERLVRWIAFRTWFAKLYTKTRTASPNVRTFAPSNDKRLQPLVLFCALSI